MGLFNFFSPARCERGGEVIAARHFHINPQAVKSPFFEQRTGPEKVLCLEHFLEELGEVLTGFDFPLVFVEPLPFNGLAPKQSQSFFYTVPELTIDNFTAQDQQDVESILRSASKGKPVIWLPKEAIGSPAVGPLVKTKNPPFVPMSVKELLGELENTFSSYTKGDYFINLPHDGPGIFIYYDYF